MTSKETVPGAMPPRLSGPSHYYPAGYYGGIEDVTLRKKKHKKQQKQIAPTQSAANAGVGVSSSASKKGVLGRLRSLLGNR
jgi:hypothetical protein